MLVRIKRAVLAGCYSFSKKARLEMEADHLTELDVAEAILNAGQSSRKSGQLVSFALGVENIYTSFRAPTLKA